MCNVVGVTAAGVWLLVDCLDPHHAHRTSHPLAVHHPTIAAQMLVGQRTQAINALRGHAAEFGIVAAKGCGNVAALVSFVGNEPAVPEAAKSMFAHMGQHVAELDREILTLDQQLHEQHKANPLSQRLAAIPGVGPIIAITMALSINPTTFESGRHFAAWLGLTPRENSTGGKHRLGRISKAGNERLRQLLVVGAMAVIRYAKPGSKSASAWLLQLLERRPRKVAAVALANKIARVIWAMMARGEAYRQKPAIA
jgi:transposase